MTRFPVIPALLAEVLYLALVVAAAEAAPARAIPVTVPNASARAHLRSTDRCDETLLDRPVLLSRTLRDLGIPASYASDRRLPSYEEAAQLVSVGLDVSGRTQRLQPEAAAALHEMQRAAKADGVTLLLVSGFRSAKQQRQIFERKLRGGQRLQDILTVNVPPGFSQHHTGTAVDLGTPGSTDLLEDFEQTAAFRWLGLHAHDYGFSLSYPRGNAAGLAYEPWHWAFGQTEAPRGSCQPADPTRTVRAFHSGVPARLSLTQSQ